MELKLNAIETLTEAGAIVNYQNRSLSISEHIQNAKKEGSKGWVIHPSTTYRGEEKLPAKSLKIGSYFMPLDYEDYFCKALWIQYFKQHPEQLELLQHYDEFEHPILESFMMDSFGDVLPRESQGKSLILEIKPLLLLLNRKKCILQVKGDILETFAPLIIHQVNCQGVMNAGLAGELAKKFPRLFFAYRSHILALREKSLGTSFWFPGESHVVVNSFSQLYYGREKGMCYTNYDALMAVLIHTKEEAKKRNWPIAIPYGIGCGLGGGDWEHVVYPMICQVFSDYYVFIYKKE